MKSDNEVLKWNVRMISDIDTSLGNIKQAMSKREREREREREKRRRNNQRLPEMNKYQVSEDRL